MDYLLSTPTAEMRYLFHYSKPYMMASNTDAVNPKLQEFFITGLQEIYWSETALVNVLSTMSQAATSAELKNAFDVHARQTQTQVERLEQAFALLALTPQAEPSVGLQGLFDEGWQVIDESEEGSLQRRSLACAEDTRSEPESGIGGVA